MSLIDISRRVYSPADETQKPPHFLEAYQHHISSWRERPIRILELGVRYGGSMRMWLEYFPLANVVGLDLAAKPDTFPDSPRCTFVNGGQDDPAALAEACKTGPFDLIIDDASHVGLLAKASFDWLFRHHLNAGGIYVLEDYGAGLVHPSWPDARAWEAQIDDGHRLPSYDWGMVGLVKQLIDHTLPRTVHNGYPIARIDICPAIAFVVKIAPPLPTPVADFINADRLDQRTGSVPPR